MEIDKGKELIVVDGEGKEHKMEILFTYENEERGTKYVFFFNPKTPDDIIPMRYTDNFELEEIEDEEEFKEVEEVFNSYNEDPKIQELKEN